MREGEIRSVTRKFAWLLLVGLILAGGYGIVQAESVFVAVSTNKCWYDWGETVAITVSVTNTGTSTLYFTFGTTHQAGYRIYNHKFELVWTTTNDIYLQVVTYLTLQPGETKTYTFWWPQRSETAVKIKPGIYWVQGYFVGTWTWSELVSFGIKGRGTG